jgi:Tol biopolymer transport system component
LNNYRWLAISADGTKLITGQFVFYTNLWTIDEKNAEPQKQLTAGNSNRDGFYGIDYFSNGEIVYASNEGASGETNLWRINPIDGERRQLTAGAGSLNINPAVSPDDKFIYFTSNRAGKSRIWRVERDGANPQQITFGENFSETHPQISPDGKYLYFIRKDKKSSAVWRKSLIEEAEEKLTDEKRLAPVNCLALSPDGSKIAFHHLTEQIDSENVKQAYQIAVVDISNPETVRFYSIGGGKVEVYWTADGAAFDYIDHPKDKDVIWRVSLSEKTEPQTVRTFPKEAIFFIARSPDGKTDALARGQFQNDALLLTNFE